MGGTESLVIALAASAIGCFALFEVLRRRPGTSESASDNLAAAGAIGAFLLMTAALGVAIKHWL